MSYIPCNFFFMNCNIKRDGNGKRREKRYKGSFFMHVTCYMYIFQIQEKKSMRRRKNIYPRIYIYYIYMWPKKSVYSIYRHYSNSWMCAGVPCARKDQRPGVVQPVQVCPRSLDPFYKVSNYINLVKTSWTDSTHSWYTEKNLIKTPYFHVQVQVPYMIRSSYFISLTVQRHMSNCYNIYMVYSCMCIVYLQM